MLVLGRRERKSCHVKFTHECAFALLQVAPDAPEIVAGIARLAECLDKASTFSDRAASFSSGSPMSTNTTTSRQ